MSTISAVVCVIFKVLRPTTVREAALLTVRHPVSGGSVLLRARSLEDVLTRSSDHSVKWGVTSSTRRLFGRNVRA